ncbi:MAG TPA: tyrosine-type recombinase/integrase [Streptosporangiaceae bacterium]|jgi:integrase
MSELSGHLEDYLRLRRALGFKLEFPGLVLPSLVSYLEAAGAATVTAELAIAWAGLPRGVLPITWAHRLGAARGFARYLKTIDPATEIPPAGVWPSVTPRPQPWIWAEADIGRLLTAARALRPPLRAATYETLLGLLAATGMRLGEAIALDRADAGLADGVLTIRDGKFSRSRLVPLHPTAVGALRSYAACRDLLCPRPKTTRFFVSTVGTPLRTSGVDHTFAQLTTALGLRTAACRPRIHDLRHSFTVRQLLRWHRAGADVHARMPVLSAYLGHVSPEGTYWYLTAVPELMELAAARLASRGSR